MQEFFAICSPRLSPAQYSLNSVESWPKTPSIHSFFVICAQEGEHALRVSDLEEDVRHRTATIATLEMELRQLQAATDDMGKQLDQKTKEIMRVKNEANMDAR